MRLRFSREELRTKVTHCASHLMKIKPIKSEQDYQAALQRLDQIFDAKPETSEGDEFELLSILIDQYENTYFPIENPHPIEAIKFRMEQLEMKPSDLIPILGFKSRVSEILNGKRKLTLAMIRNLHTILRIPIEVLVQEY